MGGFTNELLTNWDALQGQPFGQKTSGAVIFGQPNWRRHPPALLPRSVVSFVVSRFW